jgi:transposase
MGSRVELFAAIRRDHRVEGSSIRELADRYHVHRRTVRAALESAAPPARKVPERSAPRLGPFVGVVEEWLRADLEAPPKQRHTARRVWVRLIEEHGVEGLSYSTVRDHVRKARESILAEAGVAAGEAMVPQVHAPGAEAEVDFGELAVDLPDGRVKCYLFTFRLSFSGKAVHRVFGSQSQEAFLEGHIAAFEELGGVPTRHIRYDNLSSAVNEVLFGTGRRRTENERWVLFRSHYGFDAFYCRPGIEGAHEKGGVEGDVGRFRRQRLTPVPKVDCLDELNELVRAWDGRDDGRRIEGHPSTVGADFSIEAPLLAPLPFEAFDPGVVLTPMVSKSALITVRTARYSVPARLIGRRVRVSLRASQLVVFDGRTEVARHPRVAVKCGQSIVLDHYLEVLTHKPGALSGSQALTAAREQGIFTAEHDAFWAGARKAHGDRAGTIELIEVLLLHRQMPAAQVITGLRAAMATGTFRADVVALEARLAQGLAGGDANVVSLTRRRLPADERPLPSVDAYDALLPSRRQEDPA